MCEYRDWETPHKLWIGNNVTVLQGVRTGDGAIGGTGSVVIKDMEAYAVCVGNPARKIRY